MYTNRLQCVCYKKRKKILFHFVHPLFGITLQIEISSLITQAATMAEKPSQISYTKAICCYIVTTIPIKALKILASEFQNVV